MIQFEKSPHVGDLLEFYAKLKAREDVLNILSSEIHNEAEAETISSFAWEVAGFINEDNENGIIVPDSDDNTEIIPDLSYEMTKLMKNTGYYHIWKIVSDREIE